MPTPQTTTLRKRAWRRHPAQLDVAWGPASACPRYATSVDVGRGGLSVRSALAARPGSRVKVRVIVPGQRVAGQMDAYVVWCERTETTRRAPPFEVGLWLLASNASWQQYVSDLDDEARLRERRTEG